MLSSEINRVHFLHSREWYPIKYIALVNEAHDAHFSTNALNDRSNITKNSKCFFNTSIEGGEHTAVPCYVRREILNADIWVYNQFDLETGCYRDYEKFRADYLIFLGCLCDYDLDIRSSVNYGIPQRSKSELIKWAQSLCLEQVRIGWVRPSHKRSIYLIQSSTNT